MEREKKNFDMSFLCERVERVQNNRCNEETKKKSIYEKYLYIK